MAEFSQKHPVSVVVDIGGSGIRIGLAKDRSVTSVRSINAASYDDLSHEIRQLTQRAKPSAVALSVPGVLADGIVKKSSSSPWLEGDVAASIKACLELTEERVMIVSDGQAHALAL